MNLSEGFEGRQLIDPFGDLRKNECGECKVLASVGHGPKCSRYVAPPPVPYDADGFVRGALNGWLTSQAIARKTPAYAAIGNGLFVRTGKDKRRAA